MFFRTEESGVGGTTEERLTKLAALVEPMDGAVIRLEGHTDARGTETFNTTLSTARAEAVREALIRGGMPADRVIVTAAGETSSTAPEQDTDGMALERRVEMNVVDVDARPRRGGRHELASRTRVPRVAGGAAKERGGALGRYLRW